MPARTFRIAFLFDQDGGGGRIRTYEVDDIRFTVWSLWPLGNPSKALLRRSDPKGGLLSLLRQSLSIKVSGMSKATQVTRSDFIASVHAKMARN